uniref:GH39 n=1 Tax=uncultured Armatimonadetes bacterium TaxID=157466 RepID=A0A6J4JHY3_9BACT|nr:GH39 [uncultured Armatimonadetes bacterium]
MKTAGTPPAAGAAGPVVAVTVDRSRPETVSRLALGITHTQGGLDRGGDPGAIARGRTLLAAASRYQNVHIMGWGTDNPSPAPGVHDWRTLDRRMALVRSLPGAVPVITLCAAPDWMKGGAPNRTDWSKIETAPLPEHYKDFADLAAAVARRYPDVKHFQVWNEFKGFWKASANNWDYEAYTRLYNLCYDALKRVNSAIRVGGPYLVVEGTGSGRGDWSTEKPIRARQWEVIDYWLKHKKGAEFLCLDRGLRTFHDKTRYTPDEMMGFTRYFGDIARQVRARTPLPIWWSEFYGGIENGGPQSVAAVHASILCHMLRGGSAAALLWNGIDDGEVDHGLVTDIRKPGGGKATPHYGVFRAYHDHFGPGTPIFKAASSSPDVEALASARKTLVINKRAAAVTVRVDGRNVPLAAYAVRLLDAPPGPSGR